MLSSLFSLVPGISAFGTAISRDFEGYRAKSIILYHASRYNVGTLLSQPSSLLLPRRISECRFDGVPVIIIEWYRWDIIALA